MTDDTQQVLDAAAALVAAFGAHRTEHYFDSFDEGATFVFHNAARPLRSRAEYEAMWASWEQESGFQVLSCVSSEQTVQLLGNQVAVFTHRVRTTVRTSSGEEALDERETIVFHRTGDESAGRWLAVHEHLSPAPAAAG